MSTDKAGYVYILTNPSFKADWVKIGKSSRPVDVRSKELDNTAVPLPFEIFATLKTVKYAEVEKNIHKSIDRLTDLRIRQNREFFNVPPEQALEILKDTAALLDDAEIMIYKNNKPIPYTEEKESAHKNNSQSPASHAGAKKEQPLHQPRAERFRFSMVDIKIGEYVTFDPLNLSVKVASDNTVEYEGRIYKLSTFTGNYMPVDKQNHSKAYQGAKYFSYNGKVLADLRKEREAVSSQESTPLSDEAKDKGFTADSQISPGQLDGEG